MHVGSVPASASVPAGMLAATSSFEISWSAAYAMPGTAITSATAATARRLRPRRFGAVRARSAAAARSSASPRPASSGVMSFTVSPPFR